MPKDASHFICLLGILLGSVFKTGKNYQLQLFLEECKYIVKEREMERYFDNDYELITSSDKSDEEASGKE